MVHCNSKMRKLIAAGNSDEIPVIGENGEAKVGGRPIKEYFIPLLKGVKLRFALDVVLFKSTLHSQGGKRPIIIIIDIQPINIVFCFLLIFMIQTQLGRKVSYHNNKGLFFLRSIFAP